MKVIVTGATGNVGTSVIDALDRDPDVREVVGLARRLPDVRIAKVRWERADVTSTALEPLFAGADAVIHLAWAIQPSRDEGAMRKTNVLGSRRVLEAVAAAGVPALIYASSVGAYSEGPKDRRVAESWPAEGIPGSAYSRHKAEVESMLDRFEQEHSGIRVARMRPGLIFKAAAASEIRRLFLGPLFPNALVRPGLIPIVPKLARLCFQAVHTDDVAAAYRLALKGKVAGAFNLAAEPVIGSAELRQLTGGREVRVPPGALRAAAEITWRLRLQPADRGWIELALGVPLMDCSRAREELGWSPRTSSVDALAELLNGIRRASGGPTPPLLARAGGTLRVREFASGVGARGPV
jgi:UDP-glucose 4-epimerase